MDCMTDSFAFPPLVSGCNTILGMSSSNFQPVSSVGLFLIFLKATEQQSRKLAFIAGLIFCNVLAGIILRISSDDKDRMYSHASVSQFPVKEKQKTYKFLVAHHGLEASQK